MYRLNRYRAVAPVGISRLAEGGVNTYEVKRGKWKIFLQESFDCEGEKVTVE